MKKNIQIKEFQKQIIDQSEKLLSQVRCGDFNELYNWVDENTYIIIVDKISNLQREDFNDLLNINQFIWSNFDINYMIEIGTPFCNTARNVLMSNVEIVHPEQPLDISSLRESINEFEKQFKLQLMQQLIKN